MYLTKTALGEYLTSEKPAIVNHLKIIRKWMRKSPREQFLVDYGVYSTRDDAYVELLFNCVGKNWELHTGHHREHNGVKGHWTLNFLYYDISDEEVDCKMSALADDLIASVLSHEADYD